MNIKPIVRPFTQNEVATLKEWASKEGWTPGLHDMDIYLQLASTCILGAFKKDELIGTAAVFRYSPWFAFFGLYIVKPEYRGQGFGFAMTRHRLNLAGYRNIGLNSAQDKISTYKRAGFRYAHLNQRFSFSGQMPCPKEIVDVSEIPFQMILDYDQTIFPAHRANFLKLWLTHPAFHKKAMVRDGKLQGYFILRPCAHNEWRLGGFSASSGRDARQLLQAALHFSQGNKLYIDMPTTNPDIETLVKEFSGELVFESTRMYRGYQPDLDHKKIYGLTTLETG